MSNLLVALAASGILRNAHYVVPTGKTIPERTLLLEGASTNLVLRSENFGTTWVAVNTPTRTPAVHTVAGVTLDLIGDDGGAVVEGYYQDFLFTGDGEKCVSIFLKAGTAAVTNILLNELATGDKHGVNVTWTAGVPSLSTDSGSGTRYPVEALAGGVYRISFSATGIIAANTARLYVFPAGRNAAATGTVCAGGVQAENAPVPSSYIPTAATSVTRVADILDLPFAAPPQAMTVYLRGVYQGAFAVAGAWGIGTIFSLGGSAPPHSRITAGGTGGGLWIATHDNGISGLGSAVGSAVFGDLVELRYTLSAAGAVQAHETQNDGAEVSGSESGALALPVAWSAPRIYLGSLGGIEQSPFAFTHVACVAGRHSRETMRQVAGVR